jgi:hypothetical protein
MQPTNLEEAVTKWRDRKYMAHHSESSSTLDSRNRNRPLESGFALFEYKSEAQEANKRRAVYQSRLVGSQKADESF